MNLDIGFVSAETHTPEYLMHKYWARKPHNVINECIKKLTPSNGIIIDPFCGSGVTLREGSLLGRTCYGYDLNPAAVLITSVLINPPEKTLFIQEFNRIYDNLYKKYGYLYLTSDNRIIKYVSHRIIAKCTCGEIIARDSNSKFGKKMLCPKCNSVVRFNLESLYDTDIFAITVEKDRNYLPKNNEYEIQKNKSDFLDDKIKCSDYDFVFPENRRILSFKGLTTSSFFTKRNFTILCAFADEIWKIDDQKIRNCALLLLNASVAQCSRLIAHRNNLSTGGPAWSVPGFWIPQEHLETNPFVHIKARLNKFIKAIDYLYEHPGKGVANIVEGDSLKIIKNSNIKADLIFLDPPYGDSVPYTEFSNIWNSFLKRIPPSDDDISVSDRIDKNESWINYSTKLKEYMNCFITHLAEGGKLLITFNNNDMKAWRSLISALQDNHFVCKSVFYQIPAVISSKAQMSIDSSYISDVYSVYIYDEKAKPLDSLDLLKKHLIYVANSRNGIISKVVLNREFIISWLKNNIEYNLLDMKDKIIEELFDYDKEDNKYHLRRKYFQKIELLNDVAIRYIKEILLNKNINLLDCYKLLNQKCEKFGIIEFSEFKKLAEKYVCAKNKKMQFIQPSLFDFIEEQKGKESDTVEKIGYKNISG